MHSSLVEGRETVFAALDRLDAEADKPGVNNLHQPERYLEDHTEDDDP